MLTSLLTCKGFVVVYTKHKTKDEDALIAQSGPGVVHHERKHYIIRMSPAPLSQAGKGITSTATASACVCLLAPGSTPGDSLTAAVPSAILQPHTLL